MSRCCRCFSEADDAHTHARTLSRVSECEAASLRISSNRMNEQIKLKGRSSPFLFFFLFFGLRRPRAAHSDTPTPNQPVRVHRSILSVISNGSRFEWKALLVRLRGGLKWSVVRRLDVRVYYRAHEYLLGDGSSRGCAPFLHRT